MNKITLSSKNRFFRSSGHLVIGLSFLVLLSACGFQSMYGTQSSSAEALNSGFIIEAPTTPIGRQLKEALEDKMNVNNNDAATAKYRLVAGITATNSGVGVARDGTASRYNITLDSLYQLIRISDKKLIFSGNIRHLASYNNQTNNYFSTFISERDATNRGINELGEMYRQRIAALLNNPEIAQADMP